MPNKLVIPTEIVSGDGSRKPTFRVGQRVICVRSLSNVPSCQGRLVKGETYTVTEVRLTDWMEGVNVAEAPISSGPALYSAKRFAAISTDNQVGISALSGNEPNQNPLQEGVKP